MQKTSIWYLACLKLRDSSTCFYKSLKKQLRNFHLLHREQHWGPSKGVSIAKWASAKGRRSHVVVSESASLRHNACVTGHSQAQDLGKKEHKILTLREAIPGEAQPFAWSRSWGLLGTHRTEEAQRAAKESWETSKLLLFCSLSDSRLGIWQGPEMPPAPAPCSSPFSTWAQPAQSLSHCVGLRAGVRWSLRQKGDPTEDRGLCRTLWPWPHMKAISPKPSHLCSREQANQSLQQSILCCEAHILGFR